MQDWIKTELIRAREALKLERFDLVIEITQEILKKDPEEDRAFYLIACAHAQKKEWEPAFASIQEAIRINAEDLDYHFYHAYLYYQTGKHQKALPILEQVLTLDPNHLETHLLFGYIYLEKNKRKKAYLHIKKALEIAPDDAESHSLMAFALGQMGEHKAGNKWMQSVLSFEPDDAESHYRYGIFLLYYMNKPKEAYDHLRQAIQKNPDNKDIRREYLNAVKAKNWFYRIFWTLAIWYGRIGKKRFLILPGLLLAAGIFNAIGISLPVPAIGIIFVGAAVISLYCAIVLFVINVLSLVVHPLFEILARKGWLE